MCRRTVLLSLGLVLLPARAVAADVRCVGTDPATGTSQAAIVGPAPLAHTAQLLPLDGQGKIVGKGQAAQQVEQVLDNLNTALVTAGSDLNRAVKINVYVTGPAIAGDVQKALARRFGGDTKPAVSFVQTTLSHPDAVVAMDAVAVADVAQKLPRRVHAAGLYVVPGGSHAAILPDGARVYVSGQAEKGALGEATRRTLESLRATLTHLKVEEGDIVQLKAFLEPMARVGEVKREMTKFFGEQRVPPVVFVEWRSPALPIEIELIAAAGPSKAEGEALEFLTPPQLKPSPVFSRVARINRGPTVFVSGLYGAGAADAKAEVKDVFTTLGGVLKASGSDFRHLAKATYYVSTAATSDQLNQLRPNYYDPRRPPAASKAMVAGTSREGTAITLDMIAVPVP